MGVCETMSNSDENQLAISIPEAAKALDISRNIGYELAKAGQLPAIRMGKRLIVPIIALDEILRGKATVSKESYG